MAEAAGTSAGRGLGQLREWDLVVADPDPLARAFLVEALERNQLPVAAEVQTLSDIRHAARRHSPRVIVLAAVFPGISTTREAIRDLLSLAPAAAIVVTELPDAKPDPLSAFRAGATGYVIKDEDMGGWFPVMLHRYARDGLVPISNGIAEEVVRELQDARAFAFDGANPSGREIEVLTRVGRGLSNQEIATELSLGTSTVKTHVHHLFRKLHVSNRVQLALYARRRSNED